MILSIMSSTFLIKFKGELWNFCLQNKVFDNVPVEKYDSVKQIMDNSVENYKTHILQNDSNYQSLYPLIIKEMNPLVQKLKSMTRNDRMEKQSEDFNNKLEEKQKEFNQLMKRNVPEPPEFGDTKTDEPLTNDNLDRLIEEQIKQRESLGIQNAQSSPPPVSDNIKTNMNEINNINDQNIVLANNIHQLDNLTSNISNVPKENTKIDQIIQVVEEIKNNQKLIINVMNKMIKSQINILEKLK